MQIAFMYERILEINSSFAAVYFCIISIVSCKLGSFKIPQKLFNVEIKISNYIHVYLKLSKIRIIEEQIVSSQFQSNLNIQSLPFIQHLKCFCRIIFLCCVKHEKLHTKLCLCYDLS